MLLLLCNEKYFTIHLGGDLAKGEKRLGFYYAVKPLIWSPSLLNSSGKFSNIYDTCLVKKPKKEPCAASNVCMLRHFVYTNDWFVYKCVVCLCLSFFAYDK